LQRFGNDKQKGQSSKVAKIIGKDYKKGYHSNFEKYPFGNIA